MDEVVEVYFYNEMPDGYTLNDMFHTIAESNISRKIDVPMCVKKSRTRWAYKFLF